MDRTLWKLLFYKLPPWLIAVAIFVASSIPANYLPEVIILSPDKLLHAAVFFIFGLSVFRAVRATEKWKVLRARPFLVTLLVGSLYAIFDEVHQHFVPGRIVDAFDMLADLFGVLLALGAIRLAMKLGWMESSLSRQTEHQN